jgi:hypothetical protein
MSMCEGRKSPADQRLPKLMHRHGNPNGDIGQTLRRIAALQMTAGSRDDLAVWLPSEATKGMLYLICSL